MAQNWNSYRAKKPDPEAIEVARTWIGVFYALIAHDTWIEPSIFPDATDGTIDFEWSCEDRKLNVYMEKGRFEALLVWHSKEKTMQVTQRDGSQKTIPDLEFADREANTVKQCSEVWQWLISGSEEVSA